MIYCTYSDAKSVKIFGHRTAGPADKLIIFRVIFGLAISSYTVVAVQLCHSILTLVGCLLFVTTFFNDDSPSSCDCSAMLTSNDLSDDRAARDYEDDTYLYNWKFKRSPAS